MVKVGSALRLLFTGIQEAIDDTWVENQLLCTWPNHFVSAADFLFDLSTFTFSTSPPFIPNKSRASSQFIRDQFENDSSSHVYKRYTTYPGPDITTALDLNLVNG
jgi:hypothetical protein